MTASAHRGSKTAPYTPWVQVAFDSLGRCSCPSLRYPALLTPVLDLKVKSCVEQPPLDEIDQKVNL